MTIIEQIKDEIERRIKILREDEVVRQNCTSDFLEGKIYGYEEILDFLDTLESEKPVPADLEEAAKNYAELLPQGRVSKKYSAIDFIAGAKWQKQHDAELIEIAYNDGITIGMTKQKEQMMKEAVEGEVENASLGIVYLRKNLVNEDYSTGDKVRIIVCKKED